MARRQFIFDFFGHLQEGFIDVQTRLCTGLQERHLVLLSECLCLLLWNLSFVVTVALIADKNATNTRLGVLLDFLDPRAHVLKRLTVCNVIHDYNALGAAVIAGREGAEAFLACRVPNLQLHYLVFVLYRLQFLLCSKRFRKCASRNLQSQHRSC